MTPEQATLARRIREAKVSLGGVGLLATYHLLAEAATAIEELQAELSAALTAFWAEKDRADKLDALRAGRDSLEGLAEKLAALKGLALPTGCGAPDCYGTEAKLVPCRSGPGCFKCEDCGRLTILKDGTWATWNDC